MKKLPVAVLFLLLILVLSVNVFGSDRPLIGAQIWIEPGQTEAEIDSWFRSLAEQNMPVTRLFIMWNYIETQPDVWDFSLYDNAFRAAEKYGVKIVATLTAHHGPTHRDREFWYRSQGSGIVRTGKQLQEAETYIAQVVARYKTSSALDTWMLMNEPGQEPSPDPLAVERFRGYLREKYGDIGALNKAWLTWYKDFESIEHDPSWNRGAFAWSVPFVDWYTFWREHLTWHLNWVAERIRQEDPNHPIHVNPHALVNNLATTAFDLPRWRTFLNSLGASIHPAWHFGILTRDRFALGVSYVCDLIRGSSEPNPFWVTELQGGNNTYSSMRPMCPTEQDIAQWVWTSIGSGADRVIFWLLNARRKSGEAGEWSMLDFQDRPSERLLTAAHIARIINDNQNFFDNAVPVQSPVSIILSLETMTLQERSKSSDYPGRDSNAHLQAALGFYETLSELGREANIKHIHDFNWNIKSGSPHTAILPHVTSVTSGQVRNIEKFVQNGNTLIVTGLTGMFDEYATCLPLDAYPFKTLFGSGLKEVRFIDNICPVQLQQPQITLPAHLWIGEIENRDAEIIGRQNERITAIRRRFGKGQVIWIPSPVGLGAWLDNNRPLSEFLDHFIIQNQDNPFRFACHNPGCLMRALVNQNRYMTVITNGTGQKLTCKLATNKKMTSLLWGDRLSLSEDGKTIQLAARETVVQLWQ